jgi:guanine nucleotide exchange factor
MSEHVPGGSSVCIHSVCVSNDHQRKGIGLALIKEYIARLERGNANGSWSYRSLLLITHDHLRGFYESAGFEWSGKSNVVHGSKPWYEMRRDLHSGMDSSQSLPSQQLPPDVWQRRANTVRLSRLLSDFPNGIADLTNMDGREGVLVNKFDLLCPKANCGSLILKSGVGMWAERSSIQVSLFPLI